VRLPLAGWYAEAATHVFMKNQHISNSNELKGSDRILYRFFEILPGLLVWTTFVLMFYFSWQKPIWIAIFIIAFDLYWLVKTVFLSVHVRANWRRMRHNISLDWFARLNTLKWDHLWQLVILPADATEPVQVIKEALDSIQSCNWPRERMIVVLALEDVSKEVHDLGTKIEKEYGDKFGEFLVTYHPQGVPGEMRGKGSNETYAAQQAQKLIDSKNIPHEDVIISSFDIDTKLYPQYFSCLAWHFLTTEKPYRSSFQPVPLYHNNIWEAGAVSRVVANSGTFWQMMQQERPERLTTFSSHSMSFKSLAEIGFWQKNIVSEDSRIFWNHFFHFDGDWQVVPLSYPISMDANMAPSFFRTALNVYKQQRRWGWGVENVPFVLFNFVKNKNIPRKLKIRFTFNLLEGFWSWATNALMIFALGWLPVVLAGREASQTLIVSNVPYVTRWIMTLAMVGIVTSAVISQKMLKKTKDDYGLKRGLPLVLNWILMPFTIIFFGSIPGIEAQTRLMLGSRFRLGFWVTPKDKVTQSDTTRS
jgi:hypothetical protein